MTRRASRVHHDEVVRMVKAVKACDLPILRVVFDGERVSVEIGTKKPEGVAPAGGEVKPIREPVV